MGRHSTALALVALFMAGPSFAEDLRPFGVRELVEFTSYGDWLDPQHAQPLFSPSGRWFAVLAHRGDLVADVQVYTLTIYSTAAVRNGLRLGTVPSPSSQIVLRSHSNNPAISNLAWVSEDRVAFLCENDASTTSLAAESPLQICQVDLPAGHLTQVTNEPLGVESFQENGNGLIYTARKSLVPRDPPLAYPTRTLTGDYFIARLGANMGGQKQIMVRTSGGKLLTLGEPMSVNEPAFWTYWLSPDGRQALVNGTVRQLEGSEAVGVHERDRWMLAIVDLATGAVRPLSNSPGFFMYSGEWKFSGGGHNVIFERDRRAVLIASPQRIGKALTWSVLEYDLTTRRSRLVGHGPTIDLGQTADSMTAFTPTQYGSASIELSPSGLVLTTYRLKGVTTKTAYKRVGEQWEMTAWPSDSNAPGGGVSVPRFRVEIRQGPVMPPVIIATDGIRETSLTSQDPVLQGVRIAPTRFVSWKDTAGRSWSAGLILPPDRPPNSRFPLAIQLYHAASPDAFDPGGAAPVATYAAQALAARGIAVLMFPGSLPDVSQGDEFSCVQRGVESAVAMLASDGTVDPNRIGIVGHSHYAAEIDWILTHHSTVDFKAVVSNEGPGAASYFEYLMFYLAAVDRGQAPIISRQYENLYGGKSFWDDKQRWLADAPGFNYDRIHTPMLITESGGERGNPRMIVDLYATLRALGRPVELIDFPFGAHVMGRPAQRFASQQLTVDWLSFWLQGYEDPVGQKRDQYARWERLCGLKGNAQHATASCIPFRMQ